MPRLVLTFDDGPGPYTRLVLDKLRKHRIRATFFDVGVRVQANPRLARAEAADGHLTLNHTWDHPDLTKIAIRDIAPEVTRTAQALAAAGTPLPCVPLFPSWRTPTPSAYFGKPAGLI